MRPGVRDFDVELRRRKRIAEGARKAIEQAKARARKPPNERNTMSKITVTLAVVLGLLLAPAVAAGDDARVDRLRDKVEQLRVERSCYQERSLYFEARSSAYVEATSDLILAIVTFGLEDEDGNGDVRELVRSLNGAEDELQLAYNALPALPSCSS